MPRKGSYEGKQKSIILSPDLERKLVEIRENLGVSTDSEAMRFLINDYHKRNRIKGKEEKEDLN